MLLDDMQARWQGVLTHVLRRHRFERGEEKENNNEGYPCNSDSADREIPLAQTEGPRDELVTARCDAQEDWQCIGSVETDYRSAINDSLNKQCRKR